jgi:FHA domain/Domain of unknown function (DUF4162)
LLADRVGIIDRGRIVAEGTPDSLKNEIGRPTVEVVPEREADRARIEMVLSRFGDRVPGSPNLPQGIAYQLQGHTAALADVIRALDGAQIALGHLALHTPSLDDVFLSKTGRQLEGEGEAEGVAEAPPAAAVPEAAVELPPVDLRLAAAGRSKIQKLPTAMLKDWMADRHLKEAQAAAATAPTPVLVVTRGPLAGKTLAVEGPLVIGREGDLAIADPEVSRKHAVIRVVDGALVIDDMQSLNGSWVNGRRVELPTLLAPGDVITLGTSAIEVRPA